MFGCHRQANQSAAILRHEMDYLRRDLFRGDSQIALVFAAFIVNDDYHLTRAYRRDGILDACEGARAGVALPDNLKSSSHEFLASISNSCNSFHNYLRTQRDPQAIADVSPFGSGLTTKLPGGDAYLR